MSLLKKEPGQPEAEPVKKKRSANPELVAMSRIDAILEVLPAEVKKRVLGWVADKHLPTHTATLYGVNWTTREVELTKKPQVSPMTLGQDKMIHEEIRS